MRNNVIPQQDQQPLTEVAQRSYVNSSYLTQNINSSRLSSLLKLVVFLFFAYLLFQMAEKVFSLNQKLQKTSQLIASSQYLIRNMQSQAKSMKAGHLQFYNQEEEAKLKILNNKISELENNLFGVIKSLDEDQSHQGIIKSLQEYQMLVEERKIVLDLLVSHSKELVRQKKIVMINEMALKQDFLEQKIRNPWALSKINLKTPYIDTLQRRHSEEQLLKEQERLQKQYHIGSFASELPLCIVVTTRNNARNYRYQYNIQSIINQDYNNYKTYIVDDASTDGTADLIQTFLKNAPKNSQKFTLIRNQQRKTAVPNINRVIRKHCDKHDIAVLISGDDQILGKKVFKLLNAVYQTRKPGVAYTNHFYGNVRQNNFWKGYSTAYDLSQIKNKKYRYDNQKFGHMRTFAVELYLQIKDEHLKYPNGTWIQATYDQTILMPILQMACDSVQYIDEYVYVYNYGTGENDGEIHHQIQAEAALYVRQIPRYDCLKKYQKYVV